MAPVTFHLLNDQDEPLTGIPVALQLSREATSYKALTTHAPIAQWQTNTSVTPIMVVADGQECYRLVVETSAHFGVNPSRWPSISLDLQGGAAVILRLGPDRYDVVTHPQGFPFCPSLPTWSVPGSGHLPSGPNGRSELAQIFPSGDPIDRLLALGCQSLDVLLLDRGPPEVTHEDINADRKTMPISRGEIVDDQRVSTALRGIGRRDRGKGLRRADGRVSKLSNHNHGRDPKTWKPIRARGASAEVWRSLAAGRVPAP